MLEYLELRDIGPVRQARLEFGERLNFITGDNGLGKTFFLDAAWWALTRNWANDRFVPHLPQHEKPSIGFGYLGGGGGETQFVEKRWSPIPREALPDATTLYVQADGGMAIFDRSISERPIKLRRDEVWEGLVRGEDTICNGLMKDWENWRSGGEEEKELFQLLKKVLKDLSPSDLETLKPSSIDASWTTKWETVPAIEMPYGSIPVTSASAGIKRVVALAYMMVWMYWQRRRVQGPHWTRGSQIVVLLDEVESHLHPQWQRRLIPALFRVIKKLHPKAGVQFVASTHAPLVLASAESLFSESRDALFSLALQERRVIVEKQCWQIRGEVSSWLTSEVFGLESARALEGERAIAAAMEAVDQADMPAGQLREIHSRLREALKDTDPFWVRWLYYVERKGIEL
jgi:hypothetical protein